MKTNSSGQPSILVDLKKYRIRIHKRTLHLIGTPEYILLLVNPNKHTLVIASSNRFDSRAYRINRALYKGKPSIELYSKSLMKSLRDTCNYWQDNQLYRLYGEYVSTEGIARFNMSEALLVNGDY